MAHTAAAEAARKAVTSLLSQLGVNDWEEETADLLLGVACAEAAELLAGASRLQGSTLITADDVRQAAFLREGEPPSEAEARKRRKAINEQPLPVVDDTEFLMLTQEKPKPASRVSAQSTAARGKVESASRDASDQEL
mmetsp:Transcript_2255/g.5134  ORF Transcript_2255/g.5134 Transcript_2255/m.5134 type:complete len:138 (-) Transcript_2255:116-529(-)